MAFDEHVRYAAKSAVALRRNAGQDHATIRREVIEAVSKTFEKRAQDIYEHETIVAVIQRAVDEELARPPRSPRTSTGNLEI